MDGLKTAGFVLAWMLGMVLLWTGIIALGESAKAWRCGRYAIATDQVTKYVRFDQCYVRVGGQWRALRERRAED